MSEKDYYEILEVHSKASQAVIDKAYHALAQKYHPDMHSSYKKKWAEARFKELARAYEVLSHSKKREEYDQLRSARLSPEKSHLRNKNSNQREEAYFYYRSGVEYYQKVAKKKSFWYGYTGRWAKDLSRAEKKFLEVIDNYAGTPFVEEARYYYFCILAREYDYSSKHQAKVEVEFNQFSKDYPSSKWLMKVFFELARFYILKGFKLDKAVKILTNFREHFHNELREKAEIFLEIAKEERGKSHGNRFIPRFFARINPRYIFGEK